MTDYRFFIAAAVGTALGVGKAILKERDPKSEEPIEEEERELSPAELKAANRWFGRELDP